MALPLCGRFTPPEGASNRFSALVHDLSQISRVWTQVVLGLFGFFGVRCDLVMRRLNASTFRIVTSTRWAQFISELVAGFLSARTSFLSPTTGHDTWIAFVLIGFCRHESSK